MRLGPEVNVNSDEWKKIKKTDKSMIYPVEDSGKFSFFIEDSDLDIYEQKDYLIPVDGLKEKNNGKYIKRPDLVELHVNNEIILTPVDIKGEKSRANQIAEQTSPVNLARLINEWDYMNSFVLEIRKQFPDKNLRLQPGYIVGDIKNTRKSLDDYIKETTGHESLDFNGSWPKPGEDNLDNKSYIIEILDNNQFLKDLRKTKNRIGKKEIPGVPVYALNGFRDDGTPIELLKYHPGIGIETFSPDFEEIDEEYNRIYNTPEKEFADALSKEEYKKKMDKIVKYGRLTRINQAISNQKEKLKEYEHREKETNGSKENLRKKAKRVKESLNNKINDRKEIIKELSNNYQYFKKQEWKYQPHALAGEAFNLKKKHLDQLKKEYEIKEEKFIERYERDIQLNNELDKFWKITDAKTDTFNIPRQVYLNLENHKNKPRIYKITFFNQKKSL